MTHPMDRGETMGRRLAALRALRGWTQTEAAEKAGISQGYLSSIENDDAGRTPVGTVEKLASIYEATLDYVVRGVSSQVA